MSQHTPGPWERSNNSIVSRKASCVVVRLPAQTDRVGDEPTEQIERWDADARLIAAAPEMLEALDNAYNKISDELERLYHNAFPSCCGKVTVSECCGDLEQTWTAEDSQAMDFLAPIHEAMRAALAKAKGVE